MSFDLFAYRDLQDTVADCEDKYDLIERAVLDPSVMERFREKQSGEFISRLDRFMMELEDDLPDFCDVEYHGFRKKESEIINLFYFKFSEIPLLSRMEAVAEYFIDEVETLRQRDLADEEREEILAKFMKMYSTRDCYILYSRFLKSEGYRPLPKRAPEKRRLSYEDVLSPSLSEIFSEPVPRPQRDQASGGGRDAGLFKSAVSFTEKNVPMQDDHPGRTGRRRWKTGSRMYLNSFRGSSEKISGSSI